VTLSLGCIADDYTGASDLANTLTKCGLRTIQTIGVPSGDLALPDVDGVVVSLKSRSIDPGRAVVLARAAERWLRQHGTRHVLFKICSTFDSTDVGNIGPVLDALRADGGDQIVLVTPAFPETHRTVYQGHLFVGAVPLNESPLKDHPLNPMRDANLVRVLARQSQLKVGLIDLAVVAAGPKALRQRSTKLAEAGVGAAIVDAVFERDLEILGEVALEHKVSVGASGLGLGLARALVQRGLSTRSSEVSITSEPVGGLAACLAGSCSQATLAQVANAQHAMPVLQLDPERLVMDSTDAVAQALAWALDRLGTGPVVIASSSAPDLVAMLQARHGRETAGHAIEQAIAQIAVGLVEHGVRRLVLAGGETAGAVVDRLEIPAFLVGPEIAPGVPVLRTVAGKGDDMVLALKSGNFGGPQFFSDALALMR
jgi:3-dehydrotetronate 4-kinase